MSIFQEILSRPWRRRRRDLEMAQTSNSPPKNRLHKRTKHEHSKSDANRETLPCSTSHPLAWASWLHRLFMLYSALRLTAPSVPESGSRLYCGLKNHLNSETGPTARQDSAYISAPAVQLTLAWDRYRRRWRVSLRDGSKRAARLVFLHGAPAICPLRAETCGREHDFPVPCQSRTGLRTGDWHPASEDEVVPIARQEDWPRRLRPCDQTRTLLGKNKSERIFPNSLAV
jgi:hypothetical protein